MEKGQVPNLWKALIKTALYILVCLAVLGTLFLVFYLASILLLIWLISAIGNVQEYSKLQLVSISILLAICALFQSVFRNTMEYGFNIVGMKFRVMLTKAVYQQVLSMSYIQVQKLSIGNILTIVTSDLYKLDIYFNCTPYIILAPISIIIVTGIASIEIGWVAIIIIIFFIIHLIVQIGIACVMYPIYKLAMSHCDQRNKCMRQFIEGFHIIKCFAWEHSAYDTVTLIRKKEFSTIIAHLFFKSLSNFLSTSIPLLYIFSACLGTYVLSGGTLTSYRVFGLLAFMRLYYEMFHVLSIGISGLSELGVSINRVRDVLTLPVRIAGCIKADKMFVYESETDIHIKGLTAGCIKEDNQMETLIQDICINLGKGQILSVIGRVGAGKSSLLLALLHELDIMSGIINMFGSCVYVPQEPWILSTSIRENITYGRQWDGDWYKQVVASCCLEVDFGQLVDGDLTLVGERGITLSGGQKARISLARAIYFNADIYLLDDPLSSVDSEVARCLFSLFTDGILSNKTAILATHQLQFVQHTDKILLLDSGRQVLYGKSSEMQNHPRFREYTQIMHKCSKRSILIDPTVDGIQSNNLFNAIATKSVVNEKPESTESVTHYNGISIFLYAKYIWAGGRSLGLASLFFFSIVPYFSIVIGTSYFLVWWIFAQETQSKLSNATTFSLSNATPSFNPLIHINVTQQVYTFVVICLLVSLLMLSAALTFSMIPAFSSYRLHKALLWRVLRAPCTFYYRHSTGSIINRFSKDTFTMDYILPHVFYLFCHYFNFIFFLAISAVIAHWLTIIPNLILLIFLIIFRLQLVRTIRQIKRIESAAKSDVISHTSLSLHGISSIHSLELEKHQNNKMCELENTHTKCWRVFFAFSRFFAFQLDIVIAVYFVMIAIILIVLREQLSPAVSAYVLLQIFNLLDASQFALRLSAELEMHMVSVERVLDYIGIPQEAPLTNMGCRFKVTKGDIEFKNVQLRYFPDLPLALRGVSFRVRAGERLGIVGRTGAGKSSLHTAILRLVELTSGQIAIDGVDISSVGLHTLRGEISVIPQDPVLFSGPLRSALDPFSSFLDDELWEALRDVQLNERIIQLKGQLNFLVSEGGSNFSVGERQLLCLARAILKRSRILLLDEATSNVDPITDNRIQQVLYNKFKDSTLLTIAHRIHSIIDYDRIALMEDGQLVEFDTPHKLLEDTHTRFSRLVRNIDVSMRINSNL